MIWSELFLDAVTSGAIGLVVWWALVDIITDPAALAALVAVAAHSGARCVGYITRYIYMEAHQ